VLGCVGRNEAFVLPFDWIHRRVKLLYVTERDDRRYWHISLWPAENGEMALHMKDGGIESVEQFKLPLIKARSASL
jgi:hypothetical protein